MRRLLALLLLLPALAFGQVTQHPILCDKNAGTPCTTNPPTTGVGSWDPSWLAYGKINTDISALNSAVAPPAFTGIAKANSGSPLTAATPADAAATIGGLLQLQTATELAAGVTPTNLGWPVGDIRRYGAIGDGTTDDSGAIQNAFNVGGQVSIPCGIWRLANGVTIPAGTYVTGGACFGSSYVLSNPQNGTTLQCDASVAGACVEMNGYVASIGGASSAGISHVQITRATGTIPAGTVGLLVTAVVLPTIEYVTSESHAVGFEFALDQTHDAGIAAYINNIYTSNVTDTDLLVDTWAELYIVHARFGGARDAQTANSYVRIQGGSTTDGSQGPNSTKIVSSQFNGGKNRNYWVDFSNQTAGAISDIGYFSFVDDYVEGVSAAYIHTDSSWPVLASLMLNNNKFNAPASPTMFSLSSSTQLKIWQLSNNTFTGPVSISPAAGASLGNGIVQSSNNWYGQGISVVGPDSNFDFTSMGDYPAGGFNLSGTFHNVVALINRGPSTPTDTSTANSKTIMYGDGAMRAQSFLIGAAQSQAGFSVDVQTNGTSQGNGIAASYWGNNGSPGYLLCGKSRGAAVGTHAALQQGDHICDLSFQGDDSGALQQSSGIEALADGNFSSGSAPGAICMATTPAGATVMNARLCALNSGAMKLEAGFTSSSIPSCSAIGAGGFTYVTDGSALSSSTVGTTYSGGGSSNVPVFCNGTNWIYY